MKTKRQLYIILGVIILLLIPLIAMQFTKEVNWELNDFIVASVLLMGTGLAIEFVSRKIKSKTYRILLILFLLLSFLLIWAQLAVGIF